MLISTMVSVQQSNASKISIIFHLRIAAVSIEWREAHCDSYTANGNDDSVYFFHFCLFDVNAWHIFLFDDL